MGKNLFLKKIGFILFLLHMIYFKKNNRKENLPIFESLVIWDGESINFVAAFFVFFEMVISFLVLSPFS